MPAAPKAPAGRPPKAPAGGGSTRPRDPGRQVTKRRGEGASSDTIRAELAQAGYSDASIANAVPGQSKPKPKAKASSPSSPAAADSSPTSSPDSSPSSPAPADSSPTSSSSSEDAADLAARALTLPSPSLPGSTGGFILGLLGTVLVVNYLRGGTPQVRAWFSAKFLNRPMVTATPGSSGKSGLPVVPGPKPKPNPSAGAGKGAGGGGTGSW